MNDNARQLIKSSPMFDSVEDATGQKLLAWDTSGDKAVRLEVLLISGLWDGLSLDDRRNFVEDGKVYDTEGGRRIEALIRKAQRTRQ